jgi:hypothetical protein
VNRKQQARENARNPVGRPRTKNTPAHIAELVKRLEAYIEREPCPKLSQFCCENTDMEVLPCDIQNNPEFGYLVKIINCKREWFYEQNTSDGDVPPAFGIFALKQPQHGWTDRQQMEHSGKVDGDHKLELVIIDPAQPAKNAP